MEPGEEPAAERVVDHGVQAVGEGELADASKLGHAPFHSWARLPLPWTLVTDDGADERQVSLFRRSGVEVHMVPNRS
ncbi:hypothetical protein GCM10009626_02470 [Brachybacterium sacelli]